MGTPAGHVDLPTRILSSGSVRLESASLLITSRARSLAFARTKEQTEGQDREHRTAMITLDAIAAWPSRPRAVRLSVLSGGISDTATRRPTLRGLAVTKPLVSRPRISRSKRLGRAGHRPALHGRRSGTCRHASGYSMHSAVRDGQARPSARVSTRVSGARRDD